MKGITRKNTRQGKTYPSEKTRWAYWMQAIEPKSDALNKAFPNYHPQWLQVSQRMVIGPENFIFLRLMLGMTVEQCAAYLRVGEQTVRRWESGKIPVPFPEFELLRMISESVSFKLSHPEWDGWFISSEGKLVSPFDGCAHTPDDLNLIPLNQSIKSSLERENERLKQELDEQIAENLRLRQMFLSQGVVDELYGLHDRMSELVKQIATARVLPFRPGKDDDQEKVA